MPIPYAAGLSNPLEDLYKSGGGREKKARLPTTVREDLLSQLASRSGQTLENIGLILDTPGAIARGVLAGDPLSGFNFNYDDRVSGKELLESYGLSPGNEVLGGWGDDLAGFAAEVVTDPMWLFQAGLGVSTRAARAAANADILQYAPKAAMAKYGTVQDALDAARQTMTGKAAITDLGKARVPLSADTLDVRPIIGERVARYKTTLQDALNMTPAPRRQEALRQIKDYLGSDEAVSQAMNERLGNMFGFGFGKSRVGFTPFSEKTTEKALDFADFLGQSVAWSPVGRYFGSLFQEPIYGRTDLAGQVDALKAAKKVAAGRELGNLFATAHGQLLRNVKLNDDAKRILGADSMFSREGNDALLRLTNNKATPQDLALVAEVPELNSVVQNFVDFSEYAIARAQRLGLSLPELKSRFENRFNPRNPTELEFGDFGSGPGSSLDFSGRIQHQQQRNIALDLPGGDIDLREVSRLPKVRQHAMQKTNSTLTDEEVGMEIYDFILNKHGNPMVTLEQATAAGRAMRAAMSLREAAGAGPLIQAARDEADGIMARARAAVYQSSDEADDAISRAQRQADQVLFEAEQQANNLGRREGGIPSSDPFGYDPGVAEGVNLDQTTEVGRVMRKMKEDLPANVSAFGEHPINAQMRMMVNTAVRDATTRHIFDSVAEHSAEGLFTRIPGETMRPLEEVIGKYSNSLGFRPATPSPTAAGGLAPDSAVTLQIQARLARRLNMPLYVTDAGGNTFVNPRLALKNFYIPESVADRLVRVSDFYNVPQAQEEIGNMFSLFTNLWKAFTLAWPSRFSRDAYSNLASVWLETGDAAVSIAGMNAARHILAGNSDKAMGFLAKIPRYSQFVQGGKVVDPDGLMRMLELDAGSNGVLSGLATTDLLTTNVEGQINQFIPGATPMSISQGFKELLPDGSRNVSQALQDFGTIKGFTNTYETRNPWLNAGQKIGETVDSMGRLGGFLALLRKGVGPQAASKRMKAALVDYSSLTPFERHWMKNIFLWWSYQSRIGKYAVESLAKNPGGRYAQMIRAVNDLQRPGEGEYIPTALRQQVAVRLPDSMQLDPNATTYLKNIDLPGLDVLNVVAPAPLGQMFPINVQGTLQELLNQSNPLLKTAGELAFNTDLYSKRPLQEARTASDKIFAAAVGDQTARLDPVLKSVINNFPGINRPMSTLATIVDPTIEDPLMRALKVLVNESTGLRLQTVDPEYELLDARNKIGEFLRRYQNTFMQRYIPKERLPELPPEAILFNALDSELQSDLTDFYQRKRQAKEFGGQQ